MAAQLEYLLDQDFPLNPERHYYDVLSIPQPEGVVVEVGGMATLSDGRPIVCTRRGEVYIIDDAYDIPALDAKYKLFADGLQEPLGLQVRRENDQDAVYLVQRGELTRLLDDDGDDRADRFETVCDDWGVSGNYHEFAFGPVFDAAGDAWVTLNVGFCGALGKSTVPYRGWALKVDADGNATPVCGGLRSPNGFGLFNGEMFYVDNQGDWVATNRLSWLQPGSWHGHPSGLRWREDRGNPLPPVQPASVWFPYKKMGQSAADVVADSSEGKFGPFAGQLFVGDQTLATVMRVNLEEVDGFYQGACFPFMEGFASGVNRIAFCDDGSMLVGMTDRGWGSIGARRDGVQRVMWKGQTPFEVESMKILPRGFRLTFTQEVDAASVEKVAAYAMSSYTYEHHKEYGCPELETSPHSVLSAKCVSARVVDLTVDRLRSGFVHELHLPGVRSSGGKPLLHDVAYYTVQRIPAP